MHRLRQDRQGRDEFAGMEFVEELHDRRVVLVPRADERNERAGVNEYASHRAAASLSDTANGAARRRAGRP